MTIFPLLISTSLLIAAATGYTCPSFTSSDDKDYAYDNQRLTNGENLLYAVFGDDDYFMKNVENIAEKYKIDHKISVKCYDFNKINDFNNQNIKKFIDNAGGSRIMLLYRGLDSVHSGSIGTLNELLKFSDTTISYSNVINVIYWSTNNKDVDFDSTIDSAKEYIGNYINSINDNMNGNAIAGRIHGIAILNCIGGDNGVDMSNVHVNKSVSIDSFCRSFDDAREEHEKLYENLYILAIVTGVIIVSSIVYIIFLLLLDEKSKKTNKKAGITRINKDETVRSNDESNGRYNRGQDSPNKPSSKESTPEKRPNRRMVRSPVRARLSTAKKDEKKQTTDAKEKPNRMSTRSKGKKAE